MSDDQPAKKNRTRPVDGRLALNVTPEAKALLEEIGRKLYPTLKRTGSLVVDQLIKEKAAEMGLVQRRPEEE